MSVKRSWYAWAVVFDDGRLRCVSPKRSVAKNEASRYDDAKVVRVEVRRKKSVSKKG